MMGVGDHEEAIRHEPVGAAGGVPMAVAATGEEQVDQALARLGELGPLPVAEHVEIFEDVDHRLRDVLASMDQDGPPSAAPPRR